MGKFIFDAAATAAHFDYVNGIGSFGREYSVVYRGSDPFHYEATLDGQEGEVSFSSASLFIDCSKKDGAFVTVVKSGVSNFKVKDVMSADRIQCGIETVYREEWLGDPQKPNHARILPIEPVIDNLKVFGELHDFELPEPFLIKNRQREDYFQGKGETREPEGIAAAAAQILPADGKTQISADRRGINNPKFGIVYFADWKWQEPCIHTPAKTAQWIQLVSLDVKNPGRGGGGGVGGNGTP
ncbi:MAG: hypothetical protein LAP39_07350 [Acidobacteriia bacterium]|nr:hypothetical protein [Terriglobia bacterium]